VPPSAALLGPEETRRNKPREISDFGIPDDLTKVAQMALIPALRMEEGYIVERLER
jgi:hypothetical protein